MTTATSTAHRRRHSAPCPVSLTVPVTCTDQGAGRPVLLLHGGAGPFSVAGFAELLSSSEPARVITPVHPGFDGTPRPDAAGQHRVARRCLRAAAARSRPDRRLRDRQLDRRLDRSGARAGGERGAGPPGQLASCSWTPPAWWSTTLPPPTSSRSPWTRLLTSATSIPDAFRIDPAALPDERRAAMAANRETLLVYGGAMADPGLLGRLPAVSIPTLVVWGAADRMFPSEHGRAYASAIPGAAVPPDHRGRPPPAAGNAR